MELSFSGEVWHWRGPAPFHFVSVPADDCEAVRAASTSVSYGWGMVPARVTLGRTTWTTSLWPKDGGYVVPLKDLIRRAEDVVVGGLVTVRLEIDLGAGAPPRPGRRMP